MNLRSSLEAGILFRVRVRTGTTISIELSAEPN